MTVKVQLKVGRRSITAEGKSRPQAQARALAAYFKKHGERASGGSFEVIEGADAKPSKASGSKRKGGSKRKPRASNPSPAPEQTPARRRNGGEEKKKGPTAGKLPAGDRDIDERDRIVLGWNGRTPTDAVRVPASDPIAAAVAVATSSDTFGKHRTVLVVDRAYSASPAPRSLGNASVNPSELRNGDRVVLALAASGRIIEVHRVAKGRASLARARALATSDRVGGPRRITATVHSTYA